MGARGVAYWESFSRSCVGIIGLRRINETNANQSQNNQLYVWTLGSGSQSLYGLFFAVRSTFKLRLEPFVVAARDANDRNRSSELLPGWTVIPTVEKGAAAAHKFPNL